MKTRAYIAINIDTDNPPRVGIVGPVSKTSGNLNHFDPRLDAWVSEISVGNDVTNTNADLTSVVAHELGHIVAKMLNLPAAHNDLFGLSPVPQEKEAWDVAEKIAPVDPATRKYALSTYEQDEA